MRRVLILLFFVSALGAEARRPRVVAFWATWCGACRAEIAALEALHRSGAVQVETYAVDERGWPAVTPFLRQHGFTLPVKLATRAVLVRHGLKGVPDTLPHTLIFDSKGRLQADQQAALDGAALRELLARVE